MNPHRRFIPVFLAVIVMQSLAFGGQRAPEKVSYDSVPISQPYIAMIFEDGPSSMLTPQVLKILADHNIKSTFFVVGESALSHPDILKQEMAAGHEIGSRSWSHSLFGASSDDQLLADLQRTDQAIRTATGSSPLLFSPFDTNFTELQCDTVNKQLGYKMIYWSVDSLAVKDKGAAAIASNIIAQAKPGAIIMSSDIDVGSVQALPMVIDALTSKGYKFVTVSELISLTTFAGQKRMREEAAASAPAATPSTASTTSSASSTASDPGSQAPTESAPAPGGFHPFGVGSPNMSGTTVSDPNAPNAAQ